MCSSFPARRFRVAFRASPCPFLSLSAFPGTSLRLLRLQSAVAGAGESTALFKSLMRIYCRIPGLDRILFHLDVTCGRPAAPVPVL